MFAADHAPSDQPTHLLRPNRRGRGGVALVAILVTLVTAGAGHAATLPGSMAGLGDSLTRGWGTAGSPSDNPAASWSTGDDAAVDSHYRRLLAQTSSIAGHAGNYAVSGSKMADTFGQAGQAVALGAGYITIFSGTNDVCRDDPSAMTSAGDFGNQLRTTLQRLTSGLPAAQVLVLSIPNWYGLWDSYRTNVSAVTAWTSSGVCGALLGGNASDASRQAVRQRTIDLNAAIASICGEFPACKHDHGAVYALDFAPAYLAFDYFHLSVAGEARVAAATWPYTPYESAPPPEAEVVAVGGGGGGGGSSVPDLNANLVANGSTFASGAEADLVATVANTGGAGSLQTHLVIDLPSTMTLLGPPAYERGSGCTGSQKVDCFLDYIPNGASTKVVFAVRVSGSGAQSITATASSDRENNPADNAVTLALQIAATPLPPVRTPAVQKGLTKAGTAKANKMLGTAFADILRGLAGNDNLNGKAGPDKLYGGPGNDTITGGPGKTSSRAGPVTTPSTPATVNATPSSAAPAKTLSAQTRTTLSSETAKPSNAPSSSPRWVTLVATWRGIVGVDADSRITADHQGGSSQSCMERERPRVFLLLSSAMPEAQRAPAGIAEVGLEACRWGDRLRL